MNVHPLGKPFQDPVQIDVDRNLGRELVPHQPARALDSSAYSWRGALGRIRAAPARSPRAGTPCSPRRLSARRVLCSSFAFLAFLALLAGAPGCRSSETLEPSAAGVLVTAEPLEVTLASSLRRWKETASSHGTSRRFRLGKLFQRLFHASDGRAFLSPVEARLETRWDSGLGAWEASYDFALTLQVEGVRHELSARGAGTSSDDPRAAERAALEECVSQIYARTAELLAGKGA